MKELVQNFVKIISTLILSYLVNMYDKLKNKYNNTKQKQLRNIGPSFEDCVENAAGVSIMTHYGSRTGGASNMSSKNQAVSSLRLFTPAFR